MTMPHALSGETLRPFRQWNLQESKQGKICEPELSLKEMWKMYYMNVEPGLRLAKGHLCLCLRLCVSKVKGRLYLCSWL